MKTIHHGETIEGNRFTVVGIYNKEVANEIKFGIALCGPLDCFSKKIGRSIAEGRALKNPILVKKVNYEITEDKAGYSALSKIGQEVLENVHNDPYIFQETLAQHAKEIEAKRQLIRLEQIKKHAEKKLENK
jgi:hypothetical protein